MSPKILAKQKQQLADFLDTGCAVKSDLRKLYLGTELLILGWLAWAVSGPLRLEYLLRALSSCGGGNCKEQNLGGALSENSTRQ